MSKDVDPFMKTQRRVEVGLWTAGVVVAVGSLLRIYPVWVDAGIWEDAPSWLRVLMTAIFIGVTAGWVVLLRALVDHSRLLDSLRRTRRINAHRVHDSSGICPLCGVAWPCPEVIRELELPNAYGARKAGTEVSS